MVPKDRAASNRDDTVVVCVPIPRSALTVVAAPPVTVTQLTALAVLGIKPRTYLSLAREFEAAGGDCICAGKLRICRLEPFLAWLRTRANAPEAAAPANDAGAGVAALARELGYVGGARG